MSKGKQEQAEASSLITQETAVPVQAPNTEKLYIPKAREKKPVKLTVDQFLKQADVDVGIGGLIRSMYGTHIKSLEEWKSTVQTLLTRQVR